ncbi:MAG TPA: hypothetical protein DCQ32_04135 [Cyanobacteria bacterium UBA8156]|nr:hypothetical protein [Cyanobacteria bacterium UBA8156]
MVLFEAVELIDAIAQALGIQTLHVVADDVALGRRAPKSGEGFGAVGQPGGGSGGLPSRAGEVAVEDRGPGRRHYGATGGEGGAGPSQQEQQGQSNHRMPEVGDNTGEPTGQKTSHGYNPQGVPIVAVGGV